MNVAKAYEITDAKIKFVSLVNKAANLKRFLITKAENGEAAFTTYGRIVKADVNNHFVTGIVYEPLTEDAHGNYMTEEEITKAAYYFAKHGGDVDLQHSFEPLDGAAVVESWIAKADFQCGDETVKKGTWLMTIEIDNPKIWGAIEKGDITGFSMGGVGVYSEEDTQLDNVSKNAASTVSIPEQSEKKGIFKKLAEMLGFDVIEKGALAEVYAEKQKANNFWTAYYALQDMLIHWDSWSGQDVLETDEAKVKEVLADFTSIVESILTSSKPVTKQLAAADEPVVKAGKKISGANKETLQTAYDTLGALLAAVADREEPNPDEGEENKDEEEKDVTKSEVEKIVKDTVAEVIAKGMDIHQPTAEPEQVSGTEVVTKEEVHEIVTKAVSEAIAPLLKARGIPTAMNDGSTVNEQMVEKHYLHGIL